MVGRSRDLARTFQSGSQKRAKKQKQDDFLKKQRGALDKYAGIVTKTTASLNDEENVDSTLLHSVIDTSPDNLSSIRDSTTLNLNSTIEENQVDNSFLNIEKFNNIEDLDSAKYLPVQSSSNNEYSIIDSVNTFENSIVYDLSDPAYWPQCMSNINRVQIIEKGPIRVENYTFPIQKITGRKFSVANFNKIMSNGEVVDRRWLVYSKTTDRVYCYVCKLFEPTLNTCLANVGCDDWGHLSNILKTHERNKNHYINTTKWFEMKNNLSSSNTLDNEFLAIFEKEKQHWRNVLIRIVAAIKFLCKRSLAFRGKSDIILTKNNGNFLGLIEMLAEFDPTMIEHISRIKNKETHDHYLSHQIQDELIQIIAEQVKENILSKIKQSKYYSIIMDSTPDINHQEQVSIVIRIVHMNSEESPDPSIKEYFLTFINVHSTTGLNLSNILINQLNISNLKLSDCRGQSYDNGANMIGPYKGVQARILQNNSRAFFVPCSAHSLNLVLRDSAKSSTIAITFFGYLGRIYNLFSASTHRWDIFKSHCQLYTVKQWSETRWESRINSVKAVRFQVENVIGALKEIMETSDDPIAKSEAQSLINEVGSFEFVLSLIIWYEVLVEVNIVSKHFQNPSMQLDVLTKMLEGLIAFLKKYRDNGFETATETAKNLAIRIGIEPTFKSHRLRKKKTFFNYENPDEVPQNSEQRFRTQYFLVILDSAIISMSKRFNQINNFNSTFGFLYDMSKLKTMADTEILKHCQDLQTVLTDGEDKDIDAIDLLEEILVLREMVDDNMTTLDTLKLVKKSLGSFSNVEVALRILLTIPVASAGAERSFSKLKIIKNYLRNSLSQIKLSGLALIAIENEIVDSLNLENIVDTFAAKKARKKIF